MRTNFLHKRPTSVFNESFYKISINKNSYKKYECTKFFVFDFFLFPKLIFNTTSRHPFSFSRTYKRQFLTRIVLNSEKSLNKCFDDCIIRWRKCIVSKRRINLDE